MVYAKDSVYSISLIIIKAIYDLNIWYKRCKPEFLLQISSNFAKLIMIGATILPVNCMYIILAKIL